MCGLRSATELIVAELSAAAPIARYNATIWGPSGNITINGTLTYGNASAAGAHAKRGLGAAAEPGVNLNSPPYAIHNGAWCDLVSSRYLTCLAMQRTGSCPRTPCLLTPPMQTAWWS